MLIMLSVTSECLCMGVQKYSGCWVLEAIEGALWAVFRVLWVDQVKEVPTIINQAVTRACD